MKFIKRTLIILLFAFIFIPFFRVSAKEEVNVYFFYGNGCPHCAAEDKYLESIKDKYNLKIYKYEVWYNNDNKELLNKVADFMDVNVSGIPFTVINNTLISGYSEAVTNDALLYNIKQASSEQFIDKVGVEIGVVDKSELEKEKTKIDSSDTATIINIPLIGKVNLKSLSLPVVSLLIGLVDGFNPCAMWILLFLISTLIGMKNKKRLWILGITFLVTSSVVYLAFMLSWLQFAKMIGAIAWVRTIISIIAVAGGCINLRSFANSLTKDDGCTVVEDNKRKKIFKNIKKFTHEKKFIVAVIGIMLLAASVNIIELACSAGLPVIFTQILAMNDLSTFEYCLYIFIYILFFMLDDLIIFSIAVKSFELTGISTKYSKYSHLVGGIIMLIIGVLLLVKPEWLMFSF